MSWTPTPEHLPYHSWIELSVAFRWIGREGHLKGSKVQCFLSLLFLLLFVLRRGKDEEEKERGRKRKAITGFTNLKSERFFSDLNHRWCIRLTRLALVCEVIGERWFEFKSDQILQCEYR